MSKRNRLDEYREKFFEGMGVPPKTEFVVDEFQKEAISNLMAGFDTLVVAPTGSGKTYIAIEAIRATLQLKGKAIYTAPLKALSNTKYSEFRSIFGLQNTVGLLTGDRKIEGDSDVVVATTEIFRNELYRAMERYSLVILDEVHFISDAQRGPVWEESIILAPRSSTLLMLSASISNAQEIAEWVQEVRGRECRIVQKKDRPIQLRLGFLHPHLGIIPLEDSHGKVLKEVIQYYGSGDLDHSGLRLKGGRFDKPAYLKKPRGFRK